MQAVQTARGYGDMVEYYYDSYEREEPPPPPPKEYIAYVERNSTRYAGGKGREAFPVTFNYGRWLEGWQEM